MAAAPVRTLFLILGCVAAAPSAAAGAQAPPVTLATHYYDWYDWPTGRLDEADGVGFAGHCRQFPEPAKVSWRSVDWHAANLAAMAEFNALWGVALGPDRRLYIADTGNRRMRVMGVVPERYSAGGVLVPAAGGTESYLFGSSGRHLQTFDALTGAVTRRFRYGATGLLAEVEDAAGNVTTIERDGDGNPLAIVAPGGQRTALTL